MLGLDLLRFLSSEAPENIDSTLSSFKRISDKHGHLRRAKKEVWKLWGTNEKGK